METLPTPPQIITSGHLLRHWQGHRNLTRRVIEMFPENDFFHFSIAGMRTPAQLTTELLSIGAPGLKAIVDRNSQQAYSETLFERTTKAGFLKKWDELTHAINANWEELSDQDFSQTFKLFGQYDFRVIENILYFIDNEIHHRGQMYVYLRALDLQPPFFWER